MTNEELQVAILAILQTCSTEALRSILSCAIHMVG